MSVDAIVGLVLIAGGVLGVVLIIQADRHARHDLDARVTRRDVGAQRIQHSEVDHHVQREQAEAGPDDPANDEPEGGSVHGGIVHRPPIYLPPGIPSITERLDRWMEY